MLSLRLNISTQHKTETVCDIWHVNSQCCVAPFVCEITPHILQIAIMLGLKPASSKYQKEQVFEDMRTALNQTSFLELDYWFTCVRSTEAWCNFLVVSQVFVCSQLLLCCICHVLLRCAVTRGTNPWPTVLVFLLSQGWRSIPFKRSQL